MQVLTDDGWPILLAHAQRLAHRTVLHQLHLHTLVNGQRVLVECALQNLPGRPRLRLAVVEHHQADAASRCHQLALCPLVVERHHIAVLVQTQAIHRVLYLALRLRGYPWHLAYNINSIYRHTRRGNVCLK